MAEPQQRPLYLERWAWAPFKDSEGTLSEFGLKIDHTISKKFGVYGSLVHYDMARTNVRTTGVLESGQLGIVQSARDTTKGWECDAGMMLQFEGSRADFIASYSYGDSSTAVDPTLQAADFSKDKYRFLGKFSWTSGRLDGAMIGGGFTGQSNKRDATFEVNTPVTRNVFARYRWHKHWSAQVNLDNVTNKRYIVQVLTAGLVQTADMFRAHLSVDYRW